MRSITARAVESDFRARPGRLAEPRAQALIRPQPLHIVRQLLR